MTTVRYLYHFCTTLHYFEEFFRNIEDFQMKVVHKTVPDMLEQVSGTPNMLRFFEDFEMRDKK